MKYSDEFAKILERHHDNSAFFFSNKDRLAEVCNAPTKKAGVYLVYNAEFNELIYIGSSGHITNDGKVHVRSSGLGGIWGRIVNGKQFNKEKRHICWPKQMKEDKIEKLKVEWYVTHTSTFIESPCYVEHCLLQAYFNEIRRLPRWNKKF